MNKNNITKIMAVLALFWIIIWIIGTWLLVILNGEQSSIQQEISPEQYLQIQDLIKEQWWTWNIENSWDLIDDWNTWSITSLTWVLEEDK